MAQTGVWSIEQVVEEYVSEYDWERDKTHVQNTSDAVQLLVRKLVDTGHIDESAFTTVYNLCQNDDALKPSTKKAKIDHLPIDESAKAEIKSYIDDGTGIVGKGTFSVPIEGHEEEAFELLAAAIESDDRDVIDSAIDSFAAKDISGVQNGIISPILYFLHPTKYPISNDRSREGMEECFGYEMSGQLSAYLDDIEKFYEVRAEYPFEDDFRHIDSFFNWVKREETPEPGEKKQHSTADTPEDISFYWVNQNNQAELDGEYLRSSDQKWQRDLTVLELGDIVFHYTSQAIRACSVVTSQATQTEMDGGKYYRVDVSTTWLDDPLPLDEIRENLQNPEIKQNQERYPLNKNGDVIQAYLCHLTPAAGRYLLNAADADLPEYEGWKYDGSEDETNYFWATANPSIWSVDDFDDDGEVHYSAYNDQGNKKRLFEAFTTATPGDRVLFYESSPTSAIIAEGTVTKGFTPNSSEIGEKSDDVSETGITIEFDRRIDAIDWSELTTIQELDEAAPIRDGARGSLFPLAESEFDTILALETPVRDGVSREAIDRLTNRLQFPPVEIEMPEELYFENNERLRREIEATLHSGKHLILTGPPGTGKTKLAKAICQQAIEYDEIDDFRFTTATSEWTAFDTIGGYVPSTGDGGQELLFEPRLFLKCFRQDRIVNEWLIIDEINRSDIDKAFGQLFSVLSGDSTELPYERDRTVELLSLSDSVTDERIADIIANPDAFPVTPSWRLLATMNTYDKTSLYEMSYAFMRRFNFVHIGVPNLTTEDGIRTSLLNPDGGDNYATVWLNDDDTLKPILTNTYPVIAALWQRINEYRVIGPSIVYDIIRYLDAYDTTHGEYRDGLTSAVVSLVYPQLEGMRPNQQKQLIRSLTDQGIATEDGTVDLDLDGELLEAKAADFFGITFEDGT